MSAVLFGLYPALVAAGLFVGIVAGMLLAARLFRDDMRTAQRGVEEARLMLLAATGQATVPDAVDSLSAAGLWPPAPAGAGPEPATPTRAEGR